MRFIDNFYEIVFVCAQKDSERSGKFQGMLHVEEVGGMIQSFWGQVLVQLQLEVEAERLEFYEVGDSVAEIGEVCQVLAAAAATWLNSDQFR